MPTPTHALAPTPAPRSAAVITARRPHPPSLAAGLLSLACLGTASAQRATPTPVRPAAPAAGATFGASSAVDADTMIVGAPADPAGLPGVRGAAYIYHWTGSTWEAEATLVIPEGVSGDQFGASVALRGATAIVGAPGAAVGGHAGQGVAYVFVRSGSAWTRQATLADPDGAAGQRFGASVALDNNTAVAGAPETAIDGRPGQGAALVFARSGTAWSREARLVATDGAATDALGFSVAIDGDTVAAGAPGASASRGSAAVFRRSGVAWAQVGTLTALDRSSGDVFGWSIAVGGSTVLVGAPNDDIARGAAYAFQEFAGAWPQQAKITAPDGTDADQFGSAVALRGDTAAVGAPLDDVGIAVDQGSLCVFGRSGVEWSFLSKLTAPGGAAGDHLGASVALSGVTLVAGTPHEDGAGAAWAFTRSGGVWINADTRLREAGQFADDGFGAGVAISGDTAVAGIPGDDAMLFNQGAAYVAVRTGSGWTQQALLLAANPASNDAFGAAVAIDGDTIAVGAPMDDVGFNANQGSVTIFVRSGGVWTQQALLTASNGAANDAFGSCVALSGNTLIVGAPLDDVGANPDQGSAYIFVRSGAAWSQQAQLTASGGSAGDHFGQAVAISGNLAVVGAPLDDVGANADQGTAAIFTRTGAAWTLEAQLLDILNGAAGDQFGAAVAASGATVLIGTPNDTVGFNHAQGSASLFTRNIIWQLRAFLTAASPAGEDHFGSSVALTGDLAVVGAAGQAVGANARQGSATVFLRRGADWSLRSTLTAVEGAADDRLGSCVAISGATVMAGEPNAGQARGAAHLFDLRDQDFPAVHNDTTNAWYPSLPAALQGAAAGSQVTASEPAWATIAALTPAPGVSLRGSGDVRTPDMLSLLLAGSCSLQPVPGGLVEFNGWLESGGDGTVQAGEFRLGSRGTLIVQPGTQVNLLAPTVTLDGRTRVDGVLNILGSTAALGPTVLNAGSLVAAAEPFTSFGDLVMNTAAVTVLHNRGRAWLAQSHFLVYRNEPGATTFLQSDVLGADQLLFNGGVIDASRCEGCGTPAINALGSFVQSGSAALLMPAEGSLVRVGGSFDTAIDASDRFDLAAATIRMESAGVGPEQTLEAMSADIGPDMAGLDRSRPGHYPVRTLEVGPTATSLRLVDARDNDRGGQAAPEAVYTETLRIHAGSRLTNPDVVVYYVNLENDGTVDNPENLIPLRPSCPADFNADGFLDFFDYDDYVACFETGACPPARTADFNGDGFADFFDYDDFVAAFEVGC